MLLTIRRRDRCNNRLNCVARATLRLGWLVIAPQMLVLLILQNRHETVFLMLLHRQMMSNLRTLYDSAVKWSTLQTQECVLVAVVPRYQRVLIVGWLAGWFGERRPLV